MAQATDEARPRKAALQMRCPVCGFEFPFTLPVSFEGTGGLFALDDNRVPCRRPDCPGTARQMVNVAYSTDEQGNWQLVAAVKPEGVTPGDYERALDVIRRGQAAGRAPEEIANEVVAVAPVFQRWRDWMLAHPDRALTVLGMLVAVGLGVPGLAIAWASLMGDEEERSKPDPVPVPTSTVNVTVQNAPPPLSDDDVAEIVRRELERHDAEQAEPRHAPTTRADRRATTGRNAPCSCGSGQKSKRCCAGPGT